MINHKLSPDPPISPSSLSACELGSPQSVVRLGLSGNEEPNTYARKVEEERAVSYGYLEPPFFGISGISAGGGASLGMGKSDKWKLLRSSVELRAHSAFATEDTIS